MTTLEWTLLVTLSILWGGSFLFAKVAVAELPPLTVMACRVGIAAVALHVLLLATGRRLPGDHAAWLAFFGMGFLNNLVPFSLIFWGQTHIGAGLASILNATPPLWTVVVMHLATDDEKLTPGKIVGIVAGVLGVAVMTGPAALAGLGGDVLAQGAVVLAALSYALAALFGRRFARLGVSPPAVACGQVSASTLLALPLVALIETPWRLAMPGTTAILALLGLALLSTALAYVVYFRLLATAGGTNLMLVTFLIPVSAILFGVALLGETLEPRQIVGMVLILAGLAAVDGRAARWLGRRGTA